MELFSVKKPFVKNNVYNGEKYGNSSWSMWFPSCLVVLRYSIKIGIAVIGGLYFMYQYTINCLVLML